MTNTLINNHFLSDSISTSSSKSKSSTHSLTNDPSCDNNFIKLCLNKPKVWNWELTTSQSSPNINFPKVQLYNNKGELLAEVNQPDCVIRNNDCATDRIVQSKENEKLSTPFLSRSIVLDDNDSDVTRLESPLKIEHSRSKSLQDHKKQRHQQPTLCEFEQVSAPNIHELGRSASQRLTKCDETNDFLNGFINQLQTSGIDCKVRRKHSNSMDRVNDKQARSNNKKSDQANDKKMVIEEKTTIDDTEGQPIYVYSEKGLLVRDLNAKEFDGMRKKYQRSQTTQLSGAPSRSVLSKSRSPNPVEDKPSARHGLAKSKSAVDISKAKKFQRKSSSNASQHSRSILQRISENRSIASSSDEQDGKEEPKYILRSSRAGTLLVLNDSFRNNTKVRKRPKSCGRLNESISDIESSDDENRSKNLPNFPEFNNKTDNSSGKHRVESHYEKEIANIEKLIKTLLSSKQQQQKEQIISFSNKNLNENVFHIRNDDDNNKMNVYAVFDENGNENSANKFSQAVHQQQKQKHKNSISNVIKNKLNENEFNCCFTSSIPTHSTNDVNKNNEMNINDDNDNNDIEKSSKKKKMMSTNNENKIYRNFSSPSSSSCASSVDEKKKFPSKHKNTTIESKIEDFRKVGMDDKSENRNMRIKKPQSKDRVRRRSRRRSASADGGELSEGNYANDKLMGERDCYGYADNVNYDKYAVTQHRSRSRKRNKENKYLGSDKGDQIVAIKNLTLPNIEQKPSSHILNNASEEVIFKLVQHLASLQQQQQQHQQQTQNPPKGAIELDYLKQKLQNNLNSNKYNQLQQHQHEKLTFPEYLSSNLNKSVEEVCEHQQQQDINNNNNNNNNYAIANLNTSTPNHCQKNNKNNLYSSTSKNKNLKKNNNDKSNSLLRKENVETAEKLGNNLCVAYSNGGEEINNMGSNVSRQQLKGLSGRRTQSSGDLYNGSPDEQTNGAYNKKSACNNPTKTAPSSKLSFADNIFRRSKRTGTNFKRGGGVIGKISDDESNADTNSTISSGNNNSNNNNNNLQIGGGGYVVVSRKDRNKFCGSLPNNLDSDDVVDAVFPNYNQNVFNSFAPSNATNDQADYVTVPQFPNLEDITYQQLSSCNTSVVSGQESSNSSSNLGNSTFRINNNFSNNQSTSNPERRKEISFKLPLHRTNIDIGYDQGYGSERSPEDELPPPLPMMLMDPIVMQQQHEISVQQQLNYLEQYWNSEKPNLCEYDFITQDCIFFVNVKKGPRGLGLSVSGGSDSNSVFPGLIRIKRLFPHQAAWSTGRLLPGDIILDVNGVSLTGLTNYEALEALRTTDNNVTLIVCRPQDERYRKLSPPTEAPKPPQRSTNQYLQQPPFLLEQLDPSHDNFCGEYEVILTKQQGSLGFTLRKEDESILGHCIRALVREPATTDGRLKPGDKILAVNDVPISSMTHEQAVIFLRQSPEVVKIRFYRDEALTPISMLSETDGTGDQSSSKTNKLLRPEARNLLTDLAYRKQTPCGNSSSSSVKSSNASPRKLRRGTRSSNNTDGNSLASDSCDFNYPSYAVSCDTTTHSDSDASTIVSQANSVSIHPISSSNSSVQCNQTYTVVEPKNLDGDEYYQEDELQQIMDDDGSIYSERLSNRPKFLNLAGPCGSTPTSSSKPRFQFSIANANAYELNNLNNEMLDAPTIYTLNGIGGETTLNHDQNFTSLPCETFLVACKTESDLDNNSSSQNYVQKFIHKNPLYQSVNVPMKDEPNISFSNDGEDIARTTMMGGGSGEGSKKEGTKSLLKWKGVMFTADGDDGNVRNQHEDNECPNSEFEKATPSDDLSSSSTTNCTNSTPNTARDSTYYSYTIDNEGNKIITVELNKGWNSRLGFSLQYDETSNHTIISAIYEDSVAAKDGRLQINDQLLMINDESVENMPTNEIIDGLRIIRGSICLTVLRKN